MSDPFEGIPRGHFGAVLADPPWRFETYSERGRQKCPDGKRFKGSPANHYETMTFEELLTLPVQEVAAPDCALFLWISWPFLPQALGLIEAWGFIYKTCAFSWMKVNMMQVDIFSEELKVEIGCGYWTRSNSEVCLLATKGKPPRLNADVRQGIIAPRREHSRKPDGIHGRIERLVPGPFLELFARQQRPNWTSWGNQTDRFKSEEYNGDADFAGSLDVAYTAIRERMASGGEPWTPKNWETKDDA